ncbi:MAG TPA: ATP-dependent zinc metalloprotease FtsH [Bryobacteraceae bacterium]|nr:ATP-dependent zinc metalloprotease FtsH [Bryobacteraceae bacterium]
MPDSPRNDTGTPRPPRRTSRFSMIAYFIGLLIFLLLPYLVPHSSPARTVSFSDFLSEINAGHLSQVEITPSELVGMVKPPAGKKNAQPQFITATRLPGIDETPLLKDLETHQVKIVGKMQTSHPFLSLMVAWLPFLLLIGLMGWGMWRSRQAMGQIQFGKNRAKIYDQTSKTRVTFADVAGIDEAKAELQEVVDFLKHPGKYRRLGGRIPKGVLLIGPPGTGKTLLARAVAGEAQVPFFSISGSEFVEMFVGVGAARVRELFEGAKKRAPCIVFIDELDAIGKSRSSGRGMIMSNDEREQTLNQLLVEMDGFDPNTDLIIMAATNTPEVLDPALLRPGRFDRQVVVDRPDLEGRIAILQVHAQKITLDPSVDLRTIASRTPGMVGADLANLVNEAALLAARRGASQVAERDLEEATDRVMLGLEKKSRVMTPEEKRRVAYHESGHALTAISLPHADPVHRVSIIPRTQGALGHMLQLPTQERYLMTRPQLEDQISVMLGGRGAEDLVYNGVVSTGASDDLERATELARQMVTRFGMSERLGNMTYGLPPNQRFLKTLAGMEERNYSEQTAQLIDEEVRNLIDSLYNRVKSILRERRAALEQIVQRLIEKETLDETELKNLLEVEHLTTGQHA